MSKDRFMFFANFDEMARKLPDDMRLRFYDAINDYVFRDEEPDDPILAALIVAIKPSLDKEERRGGAREGAGAPQKTENPQNQKDGESKIIKDNQRQSKLIKNNQNQSNEIKRNQNNQTFLETETETETGNKKLETESETETEKGCFLQTTSAAPACSADDGKKYAFEGEVIQLKQKDFDDWQRAYPDLNIYAECVVRDSWLREQPESERKRWFMSTAAYFAKQNERRKRQNAELANEVDNREILGFAEPRKLTAEDIEKFMRS